MKFISVILVIFIASSFCYKKDKTFQGEIIYDLIYSDVHSEITEEKLCQIVGMQVNYYHSNKGYVKQNICNEDLISTIWFNGNDNSLQMHIKGIDTMFVYFASETDHSAIINKTDEVEMILGYNCVKYEVYLTPLPGNEAPPMKYDFFMAEEIKIDNKPYEKFNDGGYGELLKMESCLNLKSTYYGEYYTQTRIAKKIRPYKVNLQKLKTKGKLIQKKI